MGKMQQVTQTCALKGVIFFPKGLFDTAFFSCLSLANSAKALSSSELVGIVGDTVWMVPGSLSKHWVV